MKKTLLAILKNIKLIQLQIIPLKQIQLLIARPILLQIIQLLTQVVMRLLVIVRYVQKNIIYQQTLLAKNVRPPIKIVLDA